MPQHLLNTCCKISGRYPFSSQAGYYFSFLSPFESLGGGSPPQAVTRFPLREEEVGEMKFWGGFAFCWFNSLFGQWSVFGVSETFCHIFSGVTVHDIWCSSLHIISPRIRDHSGHDFSVCIPQWLPSFWLLLYIVVRRFLLVCTLM